MTPAPSRTLQGLSDSVLKHVRAIAYDGVVSPFVAIYARPGALPSVKITVELHQPGISGGVVESVSVDEAAP